jgi:hypothetical protein
MQSEFFLCKNHMALLRYSLVFVWLTTAIVSLLELKGQSHQLLVSSGIVNPIFIQSLIWGGASVDAALGLALWFKPCRRTYLLALLAMLSMTVLVTLMLPTLWLHPLGPLSKNIPIAAALWILFKSKA